MKEEKKNKKSMIEDFIDNNPKTKDLGQAMFFLAKREQESGFKIALQDLKVRLPVIAEQLRSGHYNPLQCSPEHRSLAHELASELQKQHLTVNTPSAPSTTSSTSSTGSTVPGKKRL